MKRGSTPTYIFEIEQDPEHPVDLTAAKHIYVTFAQCGKQLQKKDEDLEVTSDTISVYLAQEETLMFKGYVDIEVNLTFDDGGRAISETFQETFAEPVENKVLV